MRLTRIFLKRPTLVFVFIALTLVGGALALHSLVVQDMPNTGLRGITVVAAYSGASEFAIVITIATLTSLFVSFTVTPTLAGLWSMKSRWRPWPIICWFTDRFEAMRRSYAERWLPAAMHRPWPVRAYLLMPLGRIGEELIPPQDQGIITTQVTFPPGHPLEETHAVMNRLEVEVKRLITPHDLQYETTVSGAYSAPFGGFVQEGNARARGLFAPPDGIMTEKHRRKRALNVVLIRLVRLIGEGRYTFEQLRAAITDQRDVSERTLYRYLNPDSPDDVSQPIAAGLRADIMRARRLSLRWKNNGRGAPCRARSRPEGRPISEKRAAVRPQTVTPRAGLLAMLVNRHPSIESSLHPANVR